jgi:hypothetical protein
MEHVKVVIKQLLYDQKYRKIEDKISEKCRNSFNKKIKIIHTDHSPTSMDTSFIRHRFLSRRY